MSSRKPFTKSQQLELSEAIYASLALERSKPEPKRTFYKETALDRFPNASSDELEIMQGIIDAGFWND